MSDWGRLFVCSTPIGNLGDISTRLAETLGLVDIVYAEDTRRVATLLHHLGIKVKTRSLFAGNEMARTEDLIADLKSGLSVALVSDAGTPSVSDPGAVVVRSVRQAGIEITAIPGPSAVTMAIALSGFAGERFLFEGFLPKKGAERRKRIQDVAEEHRPVVWFVSPHRIVGDLEDILAVVGPEREIAVNRELTKMHEEVWVGRIDDALEYWSSKPVKGEITVVLGPGDGPGADIGAALTEARRLVASGTSVSEAARQVAADSGLSRRKIYHALLEDQGLS